MEEQGRALGSPGEARVSGEDERDADDEEEGREDEIGRGPAVPGGVLEDPVGVTLVAVVVDEDHEGDSDAAEHVEREETLRLFESGSSVHGFHPL